LWYRATDAVLIYEFTGEGLVFEQLLAPREKQNSYAGAPAIEPRSGTSLNDAIVAAAPGDAWIHAYFALNTCGASGQWEAVSTRSIRQGPTYEVVHATCSSGNLTRDFYFRLPGDEMALEIPNLVIEI
jgi:hypothetical protein